jgi:HEPN domain-containing protein
MLVNAAAELGIDEGALKQALVEIILALPETPTVDALLEELEKTKAAEEEKGAMVEQVMNNQMMDQQMRMAEAAQQGPTGDEVFEMPEGAQMMPTGDETFDMGA